MVGFGTCVGVGVGVGVGGRSMRNTTRAPAPQSTKLVLSSFPGSQLGRPEIVEQMKSARFRPSNGTGENSINQRRRSKLVESRPVAVAVRPWVSDGRSHEPVLGADGGTMHRGVRGGSWMSAEPVELPPVFRRCSRSAATFRRRCYICCYICRPEHSSNISSPLRRLSISYRCVLLFFVVISCVRQAVTLLRSSGRWDTSEFGEAC